ncbi:serine/threonine-protein kinase [Streptomyces sp. NPDC000594]|uniref:serine/threonine-protein kinase n=1 Tax=Streptomyces sp. NPDC000594 TaxID=3154261 RepID=UPI0033318ACB
MNAGENTERRVVDGRFALEARLGGGGMGTVWRARDLLLDRDVALKEVRPGDPALAENDPEAARTLRARVLREARALARVEHPNVVMIHHIVDGSAGSDSGGSGDSRYPWLVMELVTGGSLQDRLAQGPLTPQEAARLGREILAALRAAHTAGIQHRDVKPANVLLRPDGRPVLTDFGIAAIRESTALTTTGSLIGTPDYMAPERITGDDGGPSADLWSLAMMLYVAVEGRHPLRRATTMATLAAVIGEEVPPPHRAGPLTGVLMALLVRDPAARPDTAAVEAMLTAVLNGAAPVAPGPAGATSYRLTPPPPTAPPVPPTAALWDAPGEPPRDRIPQNTGGPPYPSGDGGTPDPRIDVIRRPDGAATRSRTARRATAAGVSALAVALVGALAWTVLPMIGDKKAADPAAAPSAAPSTASRTASGRATAARTASGSPAKGGSTPAKGGDRPAGEPSGTLLTPQRIRTVIKELTAAAGTDRVSSFSVYPEHASMQAIVKGSDSRYDTYVYNAGRGVTKGTISSRMMSMFRPVHLSDYDWDVVPELLRRADRELNIDEPTMRYVTVSLPNTLSGTRPGLSVYLTDEYGSAYLTADPRGKVLKTYPAED